jgi:hypothetical protein
LLTRLLSLQSKLLSLQSKPLSLQSEPLSLQSEPLSLQSQPLSLQSILLSLQYMYWQTLCSSNWSFFARFGVITAVLLQIQVFCEDTPVE